MEVTGVYWKPVWAVLEDRCELMLGNARHVKQVPGRKTERRDQATLRRLSRRGRPDARVGLIHVAPTSAQRRIQPALRGRTDGGRPRLVTVGSCAEGDCAHYSTTAVAGATCARHSRSASSEPWMRRSANSLVSMRWGNVVSGTGTCEENGMRLPPLRNVPHKQSLWSHGRLDLFIVQAIRRDGVLRGVTVSKRGLPPETIGVHVDERLPPRVDVRLGVGQKPDQRVAVTDRAARLAPDPSPLPRDHARSRVLSRSGRPPSAPCRSSRPASPRSTESHRKSHPMTAARPSRGPTAPLVQVGKHRVICTGSSPSTSSATFCESVPVPRGSPAPINFIYPVLSSWMFQGGGCHANQVGRAQFAPKNPSHTPDRSTSGKARDPIVPCHRRVGLRRICAASAVEAADPTSGLSKSSRAAEPEHHPAHLQLFADHAWRSPIRAWGPITLQDAQRAVSSAAAELEQRTLRPRLGPRTDRQAELLAATPPRYRRRISDLTITLQRASSTTYSRIRDELIG